MNPMAFVFPGQASQYPGMGKELAERYPEARQVFEDADAALGFSISQLCFDGPEDQLKLTENTQPAILTVSVAVYRILESRGVRPDFVAGHSLGEYSALVAAGALSLSEAIRVVRQRGRFMQEAVPVGQGAMAALLGMSLEAVEKLCEEASQGEILSLANLNSPNQMVIAGSAAAVGRAVLLAPSRGAKRAVPLPVSAPFHCALMKPAEIRLKDELAKIVFQNLKFPLVNNAEARQLTSGREISGSLSRQVCSPVRWTESVQWLMGQGVKLFVEVGPGRVLSGLIRQVDKSLKLSNVEDEKSLNESLNLISQIV
jgi:[acyl-carrier-protein] S-malonyltransferase